MTDEELQSRLRAADPAASAPPADPATVTRLLEDTMSHDLPTGDRADHRGRSALTWLLAAAAVAVIAGTTVFVLTDGDDGLGRQRTGQQRTGQAEASITELHAPEAGDARCMAPRADLLADKPIAFDGTVEEATDDLVTLAPTRWYAGDPTDLVTIKAPDVLTSLLSVEFKEGNRYLVAASADGAVMICGFSGPYTGRLARLYGTAFGG